MSTLFQTPRRSLLVGLSMFVVTLGIASWCLPEWQPRPIPEEQLFRSQFAGMLDSMGLERKGRIELRLTGRMAGSGQGSDDRRAIEQAVGKRAGEWLRQARRPYFVAARADVESRQGPAHVEVRYDLLGRPVSLSVATAEFLPTVGAAAAPPVEAGTVLPLFLRESERLGSPRKFVVLGAEFESWPVIGEDDEEVEWLRVTSQSQVPVMQIERTPNRPEQIDQHLSWKRPGLWLGLGKTLVRVLVGVGVLILFTVLLSRRSIDVRNALVLAALALLLAIPALIASEGLPYASFFVAIGRLGTILIIVVAWAAAESWYRSIGEESTTGLDHVTRGSLRYSEGESLVGGWGLGAAAAAMLLGSYALVSSLPGMAMSGPSVDISALASIGNPWFRAVMWAAVVLIVFCLAERWSNLKRKQTMVVVVAALIVSTGVALSPFPAKIAIALGFVWFLLIALRRYRLLGLLTAATVAASLPIAAFTLMHPLWQRNELVAFGSLALAPLVAGVIGLRRTGVHDEHHVQAPTFLRRLEQERRIQYEMDLLARMQIGLLPAAPPIIEGWEIAVRSVLPAEVGGDFYEFIEDDAGWIWIGMGDVSGHGHQCSIAHAMTKAALLSLVSSNETPGSVMNRLDKVLRQSGTARTFVALALMRLHPGTGEVVYSNAASPFPLLISGNEIREIAESTLPLGHGPVHLYRDVAFHIEPGALLTFWSDGLYESRNPQGEEYGYRRATDVLQQAVGGTADEAMESLLDDWTAFRNGLPLDDDTTVLVLKRAHRPLAL